MQCNAVISTRMNSWTQHVGSAATTTTSSTLSRICSSRPQLPTPSFTKSLGTGKEFFGLRDFYAFIKLLVHFAKVAYVIRIC